MPELKMLLRDRLESELILQHQLKALSDTLQKQLQETQRNQTEELEKRIQLNAALSTYKEETPVINDTGPRKVSAFALNYKKEATQQIRPSPSSVYLKQHNFSNKSSELKHVRTQYCERAALAVKGPSKEEEAMAECLKKFSALPVPRHVTLPLFGAMMEKMEEQRKHGHEQRKNFLLTMQKPFQFEEREIERRKKVVAMTNEAPEEGKKEGALKKSLKIKKEPKIANEDIMQHGNPSMSECPKIRTADRTRRERIGFLDETPSFQPKILHHVPDFSRIHRALRRETTQCKDTTQCLPFHLRTSARPERQSRSSPQKTQEQKVTHLIRSKSLGVLTSLSSDTLPVYITDAVRKRSQAIRKSMELRESKTQESAEWLRKSRMRSEAMQRTVTLHAKLLDPHKSLKEVYNEKLQHHRAADQQRMREYGRELKGMRARVSERPYLFEQVKQKSAKANAEKTFRDTLRSAGVKEQFFEENGLLSSSASSASETNTDSSRAQDKHSRGENADAGEKIEDVREESVDYKADEMP